MAKPKDAEAIDGKKYRIFPGQSDPLQEFSNVSRTFMPEGTVYDEYNSTDEVVTEIVDNGKYDIPPLPSTGTPIEVGELYTHDGGVYRVRQTHNVTIYDPDDIPALFTVYRKETSDMEWIDGEQVDLGTVRIYESVKYECIQAHQTQSDWIPTATLNILWKLWADPGGEIPVWVQPTGAHDAYNIGDQVHFPTDKDAVFESVINANVWSPTGYPAGWKEI